MNIAEFLITLCTIANLESCPQLETYYDEEIRSYGHYHIQENVIELNTAFVNGKNAAPVLVHELAHASINHFDKGHGLYFKLHCIELTDKVNEEFNAEIGYNHCDKHM